jgi:acetolactate synthase-1/2/3 large subunit
MVNKRGSEYIIDCLIHNGIDTFFLVTGGAIVPTVDYIGTKENAKYFCFQHEQSAAMAAESYYRTTGKIGVVLSTSGPGAQNLLNGICGCWYESIPCLFITGQVSTYESIDSIQASPRQLGFQETPVIESFKSFTKFSKKLTIDSIQDDIVQAITCSTEGRPGPSLLDFPVDVQTAEMQSELFDVQPICLHDKFDLDSDIKQIQTQLDQAERPLLLLGHGIRLANAVSEIRTLVDKLNIPFVVSWGGFDLIEHTHPNFIGTIGVYGSRGGNFAIQNCDLLISIGSRLDTRQTGGNLTTFSRNSFKVVVDVDTDELRKFDNRMKIELPIECDASIFIERCLHNIIPTSINDEWNQQCNEWKHLNLDKRELKEDVLTSYEFLEYLNTKLDEDAVIIPDEGGHLVWSMQSLKAKSKQRIFSNFGNSSMGYSLPAAIGAAIGTDKQVICIDGDGGFQMNIQELQTIKNYNLPVKIFIINNECYGIIKQFQDAYFSSRYIASNQGDYSVPDFVSIGNAYGIKSLEANKQNYRQVVEEALSSSESVLVNVVIDREQKLTPKLEFGNPLEDMSPYLTTEEIANNMIIDMIPRMDRKGWVTIKK